MAIYLLVLTSISTTTTAAAYLQHLEKCGEIPPLMFIIVLFLVVTGLNGYIHVQTRRVQSSYMTLKAENDDDDDVFRPTSPIPKPKVIVPGIYTPFSLVPTVMKL